MQLKAHRFNETINYEIAKPHSPPELYAQQKLFYLSAFAVFSAINHYAVSVGSFSSC